MLANTFDKTTGRCMVIVIMFTSQEDPTFTQENALHKGHFNSAGSKALQKECICVRVYMYMLAHGNQQFECKWLTCKHNNCNMCVHLSVENTLCTKHNLTVQQ